MSKEKRYASYDMSLSFTWIVWLLQNPHAPLLGFSYREALTHFGIKIFTCDGDVFSVMQLLTMLMIWKYPTKMEIWVKTLGESHTPREFALSTQWPKFQFTSVWVIKQNLMIHKALLGRKPQSPERNWLSHIFTLSLALRPFYISLFLLITSRLH